MSQDRFSNEKYIDWVKLKLALQYAKEGLTPITEQKVHAFFNSLISRLQSPSSSSAQGGPTLCHACVNVDLKKQWSRQRFYCVSGICDGWLDLLQKNHVNPTSKVEWDNVDVSRLPVSPWECAKLYLPYGSGHIKGARDADLAAILTLYRKCRHFASSLQDATLCKKVKDVRNNLLHSGTMEVENADMLFDVRLVKQLLQGPAFAADQSCKDAIAKIDKLVQNKLELSLNKELELQVLNLDIKYVAGMTDQLNQDMADLTTQVQQCGQLGAQVTGLDKDVTDLKYQLGKHKADFNKEVTGMKDQLGKHKAEVNKEVTSIKDTLEATVKDIDQLQNFASLLCSFIKACHIEKVDMGQLASNLLTLSNLRAETERQSQTIALLQETVGHHGVTLEKHEQSIDQMKQELLSLKKKLHSIESEIKAKKERGEHHQERVNISSLQQYLVTVYENDCKWENPATGDEDKKITISQMYATPIMKLVRQRDDSGALVEVQQRQGDDESSSLSYRQIFYTGEERCTNIYITGDAGMGKTTFCKQLVHTWCKAVQNISEEGDSAEDLSLLNEFSILFYVNLREAESHYHIEDMIRETVLHDAPTEYDVRDILKTEKCLIVLDGLDEWSCPPGASVCRGLNKEIPGRNVMNTDIVYLTTTRNWKFDVINLKSKDVDKHVELCGIGKKSSKEFAENVVRQLDPKSKSNRRLTDFFREVKDKKLESLTIVPVLLTHLLTLWYFFKGLSKSQVLLYCKMLDILLKQAKKHLPETTSTVTKPVPADAELPECFSEEDNCCNHTQLLFCLSKLAFSSLLNEKKEESLVFNSSRLNVYGVQSSDIRLCLKCGIFTQSKVLGKQTGNFKKYSFLHKKLQEFLAAVYLVTSDNLEEDMRQVREYCDKVKTTLEMGQMFMFVCGMNAGVGNKLLEHLASVVSRDNRVQNYRQSVSREPLIQHIQSCVIACVAEGASNGLIINVHLQDYWIDDDTNSDFVVHVVERNHSSVKSVSIHLEHLSAIAHVSAKLNHLLEVHTLEKIWMKNLRHHRLLSTGITATSMLPDTDSILAAVINNNVCTLKSLCLSDADLSQDVLFAAVLGCIQSLRELQLGLEQIDEMVDERMELRERTKELIELMKGMREQETEIREQVEEQTEQIEETRGQVRERTEQVEETREQETEIREQVEEQTEQVEETRGQVRERTEQVKVVMGLKGELTKPKKSKKQKKKLQEIELKKQHENLRAMSRPAGGACVAHGQLEQLLPATTHLAQLHLRLYCTDHGGECRPVLDLSAHTKLQSLKLMYVSVTNLHAMAHSVKYVYLRDVTVAYTTLRQFIETLAQTSNMVKVRLFDVTVKEDSAKPVDLGAYLRGCDKFTVTSCDIKPDKTWARVCFYKK